MKPSNLLKRNNYLPILTMNDGTPVTVENWEKRREEMLALLSEYSYGYTPDVEVSVKARDIQTMRQDFCGKCTHERMTLVYTTEHGEGSFPIQIFTPASLAHPPVILNISFSLAPHWYIPVEEIIEAGYALVVVDYRDMVNDNHYGDFSDGIAAHFGVNEPRRANEWGKIGMWAWGTSRVLDYLVQSRTNLDTDRLALIGHSRLGKTALLAGATDPRFAFVHSNCSGYGGAASTGGVIGETNMPAVSRWFAYSYAKYKCARTVGFDQHYLLALIAPRYLSVTSAYEDTWANPESEFLTALAATPAYEACGVKGLVTADVLPKPGDDLSDGNIRYAYRPGTHYFDRSDWLGLMQFIKEKRR